MAPKPSPRPPAGGSRGADVVVVGYRNQYDADLGPGSHVSCLRSSLSFLRLVFSHGPEVALTADAVDGSLVEGQAWTAASVPPGGTPSMVSIVELPNKITYPNSVNSLCCVFSRLYGDSGFYMHPGEGFQSTQVPAREFFDGPWKSRAESFALVTIGAIGLAVYRAGDAAYVFDPHGHGDVSQALVVRVRARDLYSYLAGYASTDPESDWAGAFVFFVTCGPKPVEPDFLVATASLMYGVAETYLADEPYVERAVKSRHPGITTPPPLTDLVVGPEPSAWKSPGAQGEEAPPLLDAEMELPEAGDDDGNAPGEAPSRASVIQQSGAGKRVSLPKRRRPAWTPPTSSENLAAVDATHTPAGRPSQKVRNAPVPGAPRLEPPGEGAAGAWAEALEEDAPAALPPVEGDGGEPGPLTAEAAREYAEALRSRRVLRLAGEDEPPYDLEGAAEGLGAELDGLDAQIARLDALSAECVDSTVWVTRPRDSPEHDPLEQFIALVFERLLAFLVENGARTRSDAPCAVGGLFSGVLAAVPHPTAAVDLIRETGMALGDVAAYQSMLDRVRGEDSPLGALTLAKLELVALSVSGATAGLSAVLDELERDVSGGGVDPLGLYTHLTERLVAAMDRAGGGLFAQTAAPGTPTLSERLGSLFRRARTKEARAARTNASLARDLLALEAAVHRAHERFDAVEIQPADPPGADAVAELARSLDLAAVPARLAKVAEKAEALVGDALREYFLRGVQYSARAIAMDRSSGARFQVASAAVANLERLLDSLPALDRAARAAAAAAGVQGAPPARVAETRKAALLRSLLEAGRDLGTDEALGAWVALLSEAHTEGHLEKRELEAVLREIAAINEHSAKKASAEADLERFRVLSAAVDQAAADASDSDASSIDTVIRGAEDMIRQAKVVESHLASGRIPKEVAAQVGVRRGEVETLAHAARQRAAEIGARRDELYARLQTLLLPLPGFVGLRAAPGAIEQLARDARVAAAEDLRAFVCGAPKQAVSALHSHLWSLFGQYREALEHPNATTASALAGLGRAFAAVVGSLLEPERQRASLEFFARHSDALADAVGAVEASPASERAIREAVAALQAAIQAVSADGRIITEFGFLGAMLERYQARLRVLVETQRLGSIQRALAAAVSAAAEATTRLRAAAAPGAADTADALDGAAAAARHVASEVTAVAAAGEQELARLDGDALGVPQIARAHQDLQKQTTAARQRVAEIEDVLVGLDRQRREREARAVYDRWRGDLLAALDRIETQAAFDVSELTRLRDVAAARAYDAREFQKRAGQALGANARAVTTVLENVFRFNPHAPENAKLEANPTIHLLQGVSWWDEFSLAAPILATLFGGVDVEELARLQRISTGTLTFAGANGGRPKYFDVVNHLAGDLLKVPQLAKYVEFYRKGHLDFEAEMEALSGLRADVLQASGVRAGEISRALEEVTYVRRAEEAERALEAGVRLSIPSDALIERAVKYLEAFDQTRFAGSAYAEAAALAVRQDLAAARDAAAQAQAVRREATDRASRILREVVEAAKSADRNASENLANLKNLLRLTPPPQSVAAAIDKAASAEDIVTQAALLLRTVEETPELDVKAVEWLQQARSIIDSHPLTAQIDGKGPMEPFAERIDGLHALRRELDELRRQLAATEVGWDEAWGNFARALPRGDASAEGFAAARDRARALQASNGVVLGLRAEPRYGRLPPKLIGSVDARYAERNGAVEAFNDTARALDAAVQQFDALTERIPPEMERDVLRSLLSAFDQLAAALPKWVSEGYAAYRTLLLLRIGLYEEYDKAMGSAASGGRPHLEAVLYRSATEDDARRRACRVAALMGDKEVICTLREAKSEVDTAFPRVLLDAKGVPIEYRVCYRAVGDKLAAMLCGRTGRSMRPQMSEDPIVETAAVAGFNVTHDLLQLRLGLDRAADAGFATFARFVRHKRPDWDPAQPAQAAAEIYAAVLATTLTREHGAAWHRIRFSPAAGGFAVGRDARDREGGSGSGSAARPVQLTLSDVVVSVVMRNSIHLANFMRLDLARQHEYMARTVGPVLAETLSSAILVNTLLPGPAEPGAGDPSRSATGSAPGRWRPLPPRGDAKDLAHGMLFSIRPADWKQGSFSRTGLLDLWLHSPGERGRAAAAKVAAAIPGNPLATFTVLARMCIPPDALSSLWDALQPEALGQQNLTYDDVVTGRLDTAKTVQTSTAAAAETAPPVERRPLYAPTGSSVTFTLAGSAPSEVKDVNAMDVATCALIVGAPLVIAMETPEMFSKASEMAFCLKIFDSRPGASEAEIGPAVSSDLSSWGAPLLALDPNAIENACLTTQLERLSAMIASKPLADAPPCLLLLDPSLKVSKVLWTPPAPPPEPTITLAEDENVAELPFLETDEDLLPPPEEDDPLYTRLINGNNVPRATAEGSLYADQRLEFRRPDADAFPYATISPPPPEKLAGPGHPPSAPAAGLLPPNEDDGGGEPGRNGANNDLDNQPYAGADPLYDEGAFNKAKAWQEWLEDGFAEDDYRELAGDAPSARRETKAALPPKSPPAVEELPLAGARPPPKSPPLTPAAAGAQKDAGGRAKAPDETLPNKPPAPVVRPAATPEAPSVAGPRSSAAPTTPPPHAASAAAAPKTPPGIPTLASPAGKTRPDASRAPSAGPAAGLESPSAVDAKTPSGPARETGAGLPPAPLKTSSAATAKNSPAASVKAAAGAPARLPPEASPKPRASLPARNRRPRPYIRPSLGPFKFDKDPLPPPPSAPSQPAPASSPEFDDDPLPPPPPLKPPADDGGPPPAPSAGALPAASGAKRQDGRLRRSGEATPPSGPQSTAPLKKQLPAPSRPRGRTRPIGKEDLVSLAASVPIPESPTEPAPPPLAAQEKKAVSAADVPIPGSPLEDRAANLHPARIPLPDSPSDDDSGNVPGAWRRALDGLAGGAADLGGRRDSGRPAAAPGKVSADVSDKKVHSHPRAASPPPGRPDAAERKPQPGKPPVSGPRGVSAAPKPSLAAADGPAKKGKGGAPDKKAAGLTRPPRAVASHVAPESCGEELAECDRQIAESGAPKASSLTALSLPTFSEAADGPGREERPAKKEEEGGATTATAAPRRLRDLDLLNAFVQKERELYPREPPSPPPASPPARPLARRPQPPQTLPLLPQPLLDRTAPAPGAGARVRKRAPAPPKKHPPAPPARWTATSSAEDLEDLPLSPEPRKLFSWESRGNLAAGNSAERARRRDSGEFSTVSWDQHLVPAFSPTTDSDEEDESESEDEAGAKDNDGASRCRRPSAGEVERFLDAPRAKFRVVRADDMLSRRYFRATSLSALALLIAACRLIARRLRNTRRVLTERHRAITLDLKQIRVLLG
ncbi:large tegument protein [Equid alphaherpesvirus 3]|uniref:Large tegument protein n=1 Tax=Equid alphaherpesvirus 3 TaxID=80341 RepID=A0A077B9P5_9ALPH|nr:large tegument protein [Equid alphaherpesvirus 3]AIL02941.1 large tegument protein [Equid alphaherpesvirus 3]